MNSQDVREAMSNIREAIDGAPRNRYTVELHAQMIKHADILHNITGREFCEMMKLNPAWGIEFNKMRNIADRLRNAGLQFDQI
jgi:hypothetical protein